MLLQRSNLSRSVGKQNTPDTFPSTPDDPLVCMMYFFASQMSRNVQAVPSPTPPASGQNVPSIPVHRLDSLLSKIGVHASFSPLITRFETFPVEIPEVPSQQKWWKETSKASVHDTMLLMKFRSTRAREEWIQTREWMEFMKQTEDERVFRRIPHVRCAKSLKGLGDPIEVLSV
jgi:hypothetical protein